MKRVAREILALEAAFLIVLSTAFGSAYVVSGASEQPAEVTYSANVELLADGGQQALEKTDDKATVTIADEETAKAAYAKARSTKTARTAAKFIVITAAVAFSAIVIKRLLALLHVIE